MRGSHWPNPPLRFETPQQLRPRYSLESHIGFYHLPYPLNCIIQHVGLSRAVVSMVELAGLKSGRSRPMTDTIGRVAVAAKASVEPAIDEQHVASHPRACGGTVANRRVRP